LAARHGKLCYVAFCVKEILTWACCAQASGGSSAIAELLVEVIAEDVHVVTCILDTVALCTLAGVCWTVVSCCYSETVPKSFQPEVPTSTDVWSASLTYSSWPLTLTQLSWVWKSAEIVPGLCSRSLTPLFDVLVSWVTWTLNADVYVTPTLTTCSLLLHARKDALRRPRAGSSTRKKYNATIGWTHNIFELNCVQGRHEPARCRWFATVTLR